MEGNLKGSQSCVEELYTTDGLPETAVSISVVQMGSPSKFRAVT